jgi:hypothetical protein
MHTGLEHWRHWLLWWKVAPAEMRPDSLFASRWFRAYMAAAAGSLPGFAAYLLLQDGATLAINPAIFVSGVLMGVFTLGWAALGIIQFTGRTHRMLIALWLCTIASVCTVGVTLTAAYVSWQKDSVHLPFFAAAASQLLFWCCCMHTYYVARRIERERPGRG